MHSFVGVINAHEIQQLDCPLARLAPAELSVRSERPRKLGGDSVKRVQRRHGLLEDHRHLGAAVVVQFSSRETDEFVTTISSRAVDNAISRKQPHDCHHGLALARPGLANQCNRFAGRYVEVHASYGMQERASDPKADV